MGDKIYTLGVDIGSTASKCIMLEDGKKIIGSSKIDVGAGTSGPSRAISEILQSTGKKKAKDFSLGMKQRLSIALALVGNPEFLVLDEPTNGLDPEGIRDIRNLILKLNKEKSITVLVSSHILGELHKLATRYGVIDKGRLIKEFTAKELDEKTEDGFEIRVKEDDVQTTEEFLKESNVNYSLDSEKCKFTISKEENSDDILKQITAKGVIPTSYGFKNVDLEDYFMELIGGKHE